MAFVCENYYENGREFQTFLNSVTKLYSLPIAHGIHVIHEYLYFQNHFQKFLRKEE